MSFFAIVVRGLMRRRVRTLLTVLGIAIGIAAVVMLVGLAWGFERSWSEGFEAHHTDIVVGNLSGGVMPKTFDASLEEQIAAATRAIPTPATLKELVEKIHSLEQEREQLLARFASVEAENREYQKRYHQIERENNNLASLYVAAYQLHATFDLRDVLQTIVEILLTSPTGQLC